MKKYSSGSFVDAAVRIYGSEADTISSFPATIIGNGGAISPWTISGNMTVSSACGDKTANLFNKNGELVIGSGAVINIIATGIRTIVQTAGSNSYSSIKLDNELLGKTITISSTITQSANNKGQIRLFYVNGRYATSMIKSITTAGETGHISSTYTMPTSIPSGSDGIAIVLSADRDGDGNIGDYVDYSDLMIVEGSTAPSSYIPYGYQIPILLDSISYPIYISEPLRKTLDGSNLYDTIESNGTLTRRADSSGDALTTPTTELITVPTLTTSGTAETVNIDTTLKPSAVQLTYTGWHTHSDKKRSGGAWT